jgi:hypothetical protein
MTVIARPKHVAVLADAEPAVSAPSPISVPAEPRAALRVPLAWSPRTGM